MFTVLVAKQTLWNVNNGNRGNSLHIEGYSQSPFDKFKWLRNPLTAKAFSSSFWYIQWLQCLSVFARMQISYYGNRTSSFQIR